MQTFAELSSLGACFPSVYKFVLCCQGHREETFYFSGALLQAEQSALGGEWDSVVSSLSRFKPSFQSQSSTPYNRQHNHMAFTPPTQMVEIGCGELKFHEEIK